jgi:hypothetical protein
MRLRICAVLAAVALTVVGNVCAANIQELIRDTQRMTQEKGQMTMVWWLPQAFWETSLDANTSLSPEGRAQTLKALEDYTMFVLVHAKTGIGGITDPSSREDMLLNSTLEVGGETIKPLDGDSISPVASTIVDSLKPVLTHMLGQFGQILQIIVYPSKKDGKVMLDPRAAGSFTYTFFDQTYRWRLPLGSLMPPKFDPKTKERFPGNYDFNPYTGAKLTAAP